MPKLKLSYFNLRGRAEIPRLILAQAGAEYEDHRFEREQWPELKQTIPFGQVPVLEVDGVVIGQSTAIARYLAKEFNLAGKNNVEQALADFYVDCVTDFTNKFIPIWMMKDEAEKAEAMKKFMAETVPPFLGSFEDVLKKNGEKFLVGDGVTWADISLAYIVEQLIGPSGDDWKKGFPVVAKLVEAVFELPNIKAWVAKRPVTDH